MDGNKSKISNVEWGLVIGALFAIDIVQIIIEWSLSWLGVGVFINWIIDLMTGMGLALYLQLRGQSLASPKRLAGIIGTFVAELIPVVDELPLWGMDGIFNMVISKSDEIVSKIPGGSTIASGIALTKTNPLEEQKPLIDQVNNSISQIRNMNDIVKNRSNRKANLEE